MRVLEKYYIAKDITTMSWSVFEHCDSLANRVKKCRSEEEATTVAERFNTVGIKKLYVDDLRPVPDFSWEPAFNYDEAIHKLRNEHWDEVSLDHDIASFDRYSGEEFTGYTILCYLERIRIKDNKKIPFICVHTANAAVASKMQDVADALNNMGDP